MTKEEALERLGAMMGINLTSERPPDHPDFTIHVPVRLTPEMFSLLLMAYALHNPGSDLNHLTNMETAKSLVTEGIVTGLDEDGTFKRQVREFVIGEALESSAGFAGPERDIYRALLRSVVKAE